MKRLLLLLVLLCAVVPAHAQTTTHAVVLAWAASPDSGVSYNVKKSAVPGGPYTFVASTPALTLTDSLTFGQQSCYVITAAIGVFESLPTNELCVTPPPAAPGAPAGTVCTTVAPLPPPPPPPPPPPAPAPLPGGYAVSATPASVTVKAGLPAVYTVTVMRDPGFTAAVTLTVGALPAHTFDKETATTVTLLTQTTTPPGTYTVTIYGVSGGTLNRTLVILVVTP